MPTFERYTPKTEKELHGIIEKELDALEEGLSCLKYEYYTGEGTPDFLCVDSGGRIAIIEVKLSEDENILFQALRYYMIIDRDRYNISRSFRDKNIDPELHPRIILIAERFSDDIKNLSTLVKPEVELFEYTALRGPNSILGIAFHSVSIPAIIEFQPPINLTFDEHKRYITDESLRLVFDKMREDIKNISNEIDEYITQSYIGYKWHGRQIGWIGVKRRAIDIGAIIIDENMSLIKYDATRIVDKDQIYEETLIKIRESLSNLRGNS